MLFGDKIASDQERDGFAAIGSNQCTWANSLKETGVINATILEDGIQEANACS